MFATACMVSLLKLRSGKLWVGSFLKSVLVLELAGLENHVQCELVAAAATAFHIVSRLMWCAKLRDTHHFSKEMNIAYKNILNFILCKNL